MAQGQDGESPTEFAMMALHSPIETEPITLEQVKQLLLG